ncbi:hypothetical protein JTB14_031086 [Gonioctena quinquepunctata]|nr:hypothetical protein JTB14_031086 [Gonioctena quinquepunctata]
MSGPYGFVTIPYNLQHVAYRSAALFVLACSCVFNFPVDLTEVRVITLVIFISDGMGDYKKYISCLRALLDEVGLGEELIGGEVGDDVSNSEHDTNSEQSDDDDVAVEDDTVASEGEEGKEMEVENNDSSQQSDYNNSADAMWSYEREQARLQEMLEILNDGEGQGLAYDEHSDIDQSEDDEVDHVEEQHDNSDSEQDISDDGEMKRNGGEGIFTSLIAKVCKPPASLYPEVVISQLDGQTDISEEEDATNISPKDEGKVLPDQSMKEVGKKADFKNPKIKCPPRLIRKVKQRKQPQEKNTEKNKIGKTQKHTERSAEQDFIQQTGIKTAKIPIKPLWKQKY